MQDERNPTAPPSPDAAPAADLFTAGRFNYRYAFGQYELTYGRDLHRARLRAALLPLATSEVRARSGIRPKARSDYFPPADECRAEAEALERRWTLAGRLTPAGALILYDLVSSMSLPFDAGDAELVDMAVWLGLLPAEPSCT